MTETYISSSGEVQQYVNGDNLVNDVDFERRCMMGMTVNILYLRS